MACQEKRRRVSGDKEGSQGCEARSARTPGNELSLSLCRVSGTGTVSIEDPVPLTRHDFKNACTRGACASRAPLATVFVPLSRHMSNRYSPLRSACASRAPLVTVFVPLTRHRRRSRRKNLAPGFEPGVISVSLQLRARLSGRQKRTATLPPAEAGSQYWDALGNPLLKSRGLGSLAGSRRRNVQTSVPLTRHRTNGDSLPTGTAAR
jgi:hypothetical protein